jgi:NADH-quinone oxidoreductase subunit N
MIAIGTMISLGYYLRVVAALWMSPAEGEESVAAGTAPAVTGSPSATAAAAPSDAAVAAVPSDAAAAAAGIDTASLPPQIAGAQADPFADPQADRRWYLLAPALIATAAALFFGIIPQPLVDFAQHAGDALSVWIS